jgi:pyruvate-formate lyase-activating enzyme
MTDKSSYTIRVIRAGEKNNEISPTFCLAKWKNVSMNLTAGFTHSCYHPPEHKIPLEELSVNYTALHNTEEKKAERAKMLKGERPAGCSYCWNIEDSPGNHTSDRSYRTADIMEEYSHAEIVSNPDPANFDVIPSYVEVNFSSVCNFKCSYCSPHLSNSWQKEIEKFGPYPTTVPHNSVDYFKQIGMMPIPAREDNPYVEAFWKWWPELYTQLKHFRMTGGEPLMDVNTYKVLDYVIDNPKGDLHLAITSNFCVDSKLMDKFYNKISRITQEGSLGHFMLYISCDAYGKKAEYIRNGMDFDYLVNNVDHYLENYYQRSSITFIVTVNLMSITSLRDLIDKFILEMNRRHPKDRQLVWFDVPMLNFPAWQTVQILPARYREILRADIEYFKERMSNEFTDIHDFQVAKLERILSWMEQGDTLPAEKIKRDRADFYKFFTEHDKRRGTNFLETFPEMEDFWQLAKDAADE